MKEWMRDYIESGWIHRPLPLHAERSLEAGAAAKPVLDSRPLDSAAWTGEGPCGLTRGEDENGAPFMRLEAVSPVGKRPGGALEEGDCGNLGQVAARLSVGGEDWRGFNRLYFRVRPRCEGIRKVHIGLQFYNEGAEPVPDRYGREGFHTVNLRNGMWNDCYVEMPSLPRDKVTALAFSVSLNGCETEAGLGNRLVYDVAGLELQRVERTEPDRGWALEPGEIAWCFSGYETKGAKRAVFGADAACPFELLDEKDAVVFSGTARADARFPGLALADFSALRTPGTYRLRAAGSVSAAFGIGEDMLLGSAFKALNFLFCQRCGYPVPGRHLSCHRDIVARHGGRAFVFNGGWHDAGDLSQQLVQSAEVTLALFEMYLTLRAQGDAAAQRFLEEAEWGLDYVLKSRFGDGWRATSVGVSMWPQGFLGDADDVSARVHNNAYENFLCAGVEAFAAKCLAESDPDLAARTLACAAADFRFARERFDETGFTERPPIYWEHSWMTPESVFSATMAWSAALLYEGTGRPDYAECASAYARDALDCLETGDACPAFPEGGFFWRNGERRVPVHFNHQARDHIFAQMLTALCEALPDHPDRPMWRDAAARHAGYLRRLYAFASPYGMMPAGIYHLREPKDRESFSRQHLLTGPEAAEGYVRQLEAGLSLGGGWYLKQFPVWFSFRGNNAVLFSQAKAASLLGRLLGEADLLDMAAAQLRWNLGLNPFRQSLMYGEGTRYASQYAVLPGESAGELPVGVQTRGDEDAPYWPQMNNATYKEVWTTPAGRWLAVAADLMAR